MYVADNWFIVGAETHERNKDHVGYFFDHETFGCLTDALTAYKKEIADMATTAREYRKNDYILEAIGLYHFIEMNEPGNGERLELMRMDWTEPAPQQVKVRRVQK